MIRAALVTLCASAALVAGCGDDDSSGSASEENAMKAKEERAMKAKESEAMKGEAAAAAKGAQVKVVSSRFGPILADGRGQAYYLFAKEKSKRSECYGDCAKAWPPVLTKGTPKAGRGARRALLGTTRRRGGERQLTYAGHPLYYYETDSPGRVLCHNVNEFGGLWLVVRANGQAVS